MTHMEQFIQLLNSWGLKPGTNYYVSDRDGDMSVMLEDHNLSTLVVDFTDDGQYEIHTVADLSR